MSEPSIENLPEPFKEVLNKLRDRIINYRRIYGSLSAVGRVIWESEEEIAVLWYLYKVNNVSAYTLSKILTLDKEAVYKLINGIQLTGKYCWYGIQKPEGEGYSKIGNTICYVNTPPVTDEKLVNKANELLGKVKKPFIMDVRESQLIKEFLTSKIERQLQRTGELTYYSIQEKEETVKAVQELAKCIAEYNARLPPDVEKIPTNPDAWNREILRSMVPECWKDERRRAEKLILLRRIPKFRPWTEGMVGSVKKRAKPKLTAIFYGDYLRLKEFYHKGELDEATMLVIWLHITTGAREGYGSKAIISDDIEKATTSLIGLRWERLQGHILEIYEHKTNATWRCNLKWLDEEMYHVLLRYRKRASGSIIHDITGIRSIKEFVKWYSRQLEKVSVLLEKPYKLTPHDMRRSHISILAEFGVPLEWALTNKMMLGVGWDDLSTALLFYVTISPVTEMKLLTQLDEAKKEYPKLYAEYKKREQEILRRLEKASENAEEMKRIESVSKGAVE